MANEGSLAEPQTLLSYDATGSDRSIAARACQIVFGRTRRFEDGRQRKEAGFRRRGVVWVGQSVFVMRRSDADELADRLRRIGVRVATAPVSIPRSALESFRRPG